MCITPRRGPVTPREYAPAVTHHQSVALSGADGAGAAPHVEHLAGAAHDHRDDTGVTRQTTHDSHWKRYAVRAFTTPHCPSPAGTTVHQSTRGGVVGAARVTTRSGDQGVVVDYDLQVDTPGA
ncbi:MAG: hypothetical protein MAG471_01081 [Acidimicrobiaceae bacterium]|nr:hypothetical protein [Acidimicrobiaceae bacterium]